MDVGPLGGRNHALAASDDLTVLYGSNSVDGVEHLFRWSEESGAVDLGSVHDDADGPIIEVFGSTPDGSIVVGSDRRLTSTTFRQRLRSVGLLMEAWSKLPLDKHLPFPTTEMWLLARRGRGGTSVDIRRGP